MVYVSFTQKRQPALLYIMVDCITNMKLHLLSRPLLEDTMTTRLSSVLGCLWLAMTEACTSNSRRGFWVYGNVLTTLMPFQTTLQCSDESPC